MQGLIICKSKYGATRQYAEWLSEETGFPPIPVKTAQRQAIDQADVIILGSAVLNFPADPEKMAAAGR